MKPVWGRVVVRPLKIEETDEVYRKAEAAGIVIESEQKDREEFAQIEGELVAVGGNAFEDWVPPIPKVGDKVVYDKYRGMTKKINGQEYRLISDTDIQAILEE